MLIKVRRGIGIGLLVFFTLMLIYVMIARGTGTTPSLFGYSLLRVSTDSMEPELPIGEIIVVQEVDPATLCRGDVVSYHTEKGRTESRLLTHQIVSVREQDGKLLFTTRGTSSGLDDPEFDGSRIVGKVERKIPFVGSLYDFFSQWYGIVAFFCIVIVIFGSDIMKFVNRFIISDEDEDPSVPKTAVKPELGENYEQTKELEAQEVIVELDE